MRLLALPNNANYNLAHKYEDCVSSPLNQLTVLTHKQSDLNTLLGTLTTDNITPVPKTRINGELTQILVFHPIISTKTIHMGGHFISIN